MSRGTWTSTEELGGYQVLHGHGVPEGGTGSGVSPWTGMMYAVQLKHTLLWTHPVTHTMWIGKAIPRGWLGAGQRIVMTNATTPYGRLSYVIRIAHGTGGQFHLNLSFSSRFAASPLPGGLTVRIHAPGYLEGRRLTIATVGGHAVPRAAINATAETVSFQKLPSSRLDNIVITEGEAFDR
eukprot:COSAG01_NODE_1184_length_11346_cov_58.600249_15_plen_181_part_00